MGRMLSWWLCACRGESGDAFEEVCVEPTTSGADAGELQSRAELPAFESATGKQSGGASARSTRNNASGGEGAGRPPKDPAKTADAPPRLGAPDTDTPEPGDGLGAAIAGASASEHTTAPSLVEAPIHSDSARLRLEEAKLEQLKDATDNVRVWFRESLRRWRELPVGDECDGLAFVDVASTIPAVYPSVFKLSYAVTYLTSDFADHISTVRKTWPKGARSMREAVRMEVKAEGSEEKLGKRYWKTCSVRLLWICRTMRMFDVIMEVLANTDETPIECGRTALDRILTPYLSWTLKKIAEYIIGVCCWSTQVGCCNHVKVPPAEFKECLGLLYPLVRSHADAMEQMLKAEIPNVFSKKC